MNLASESVTHVLLRPNRVRTVLRAVCGLLTLVFAGCAVGPNYRAPLLPASDQYLYKDHPQQTTALTEPAGKVQNFLYGHSGEVTWWQRFQSPALTQLIEQALAGNFDLQAAAARLRQAQQLLQATTGLLYPEVNITGGASRRKSFRSGSVTGVNTPGATPGFPTSGGGRGGDSIFHVYTASGVVSYNLDLFGREARLIEAQAARTDRQGQLLHAAALTVAGNIVSTTIDSARLRAQITARRELIRAQEQRLDIVATRVEEGAAARAELITARADLAATRAPISRLTQALVETEHRLALLTGTSPAQGTIPPIELTDLQLPTELPVQLPAAVVQQRPDIRAAESALRAASADIGVETADLYPQITLDASYGVIGIGASALGASFSPLWSLGTSALAPIFQGGRLRAERAAAVAAYEATLAEYQQTVLSSFTQVADALRALENDARTLAAQQQALVATRESLDLATFRFEQGIVSYLDVLVIQQQYQQATIDYVDAQALRLHDTARLFTALGGGSISPLASTSTAPSALSSVAPVPGATIRGNRP